MATWKKLVQFNSGDTITVSNPTANTHAATKAYVDNATTGIVWSRTNNVLEPEDTDDVVKILKGLHLSGWYTHNLSFGSAHSSHSATNTGAQMEVPLHATNGKAHGSFKFYTNSGDIRNLALTLEESGNAVFGGTATFVGSITTTSAGLANAPSLAIDNPSSSSYIHALEAFGANMTQGQTHIFCLGKEGSTKNTAVLGYKWDSAGSNDNLFTIEHWGTGALVTVDGVGNSTFAGAMQVKGNILSKQGSYIGVRNTADSDYAYSFKMPYGSTEDLEINPSLHYRNTVVKHGQLIIKPPDDTASHFHLDAGGTGNASILIDAGTTTRHPYISFAHDGTQYWHVKSDPDNSQGFAIQRDGFGSIININTTGAITYNSNQGSSIMWFKHQGTTNGAVYGSSTTFGLLDEGGNWFYKHTNDASHQWYTADTLRMTLSGSNLNVVGEIESGSTIVAGGAIRTDTSTNYALLTGYLGGLRVKSSRDNAAGIILQETDGTHISTWYGETNGNYGFLDDNWGSWDIKKSKGGNLEVDIGGTLKTVVYNSFASELTVNNGIESVKNGSDSATSGSYLRVKTASGDLNVWMWQLGASNQFDLWNYNAGGDNVWEKALSFTTTNLNATFSGSVILSGGSAGDNTLYKHSNNFLYLMGGTAGLVLKGKNSDDSFTIFNNSEQRIYHYTNNLERMVIHNDGTTIQKALAVNGISTITVSSSSNTITTVLKLVKQHDNKGDDDAGAAIDFYAENKDGGTNQITSRIAGYTSDATGGSGFEGGLRFYTVTDGYNPSEALHINHAKQASFSGKLSAAASLSGSFIGEFLNSNSSGHGLKVRGGDTSSQYALYVEDVNASWLFQVMGDGQVYQRGGNFHIANDNLKLRIGASDDLELYHNGTDSYINNSTGHLRINNAVDGGTIRFQTDDTSGQGTTPLVLEHNLATFNDKIHCQKQLKVTAVANASYGFEYHTTETTRAFHIYSGGSGDNGYFGGIDQSSGNTNFAIHSDASHNSYVCRSGANFGVGSNSPLSRFQVNYDSGSDPFYATDAMIWGSNRTIAQGQGNLAVGADNYAQDYGGTLAFVMQRYSDLKAAVCSASISGRKENSTNGDYASYLAFATRANGGSLTERMRIRSDGHAIFNGDVYVGGGNRGSLRAYGTHSMSLHSVHSMSLDWNANYDAYMNHGIASTDNNGNNNDSVSVNSYNDINLRLDTNNNNDASYLRIMNNSTGMNQIMYSGYDGARAVHYFDGKVAIATSPDASYALKVNGHTYIANDCTVGGPIASNGQSPSSLYGLKTKTTGGDGSWAVYATNNSSSGYQGGGAYLNSDNVGMSIGYGAYVASSGASSANWALFAGAGNVKITNNLELSDNGGYIKHATKKFQYNWHQNTTNSGSSSNFWVHIADYRGVSVTYAANNAHIIVRDGGDDQLSGYAEIVIKIAANNSTHYAVGAHLIKHFGFAGISDVKVFRKSSYGNTDADSTYEIWCKYGQAWVDQFSYEAHVTNGWGTFVPITTNTATTTTPSGGDNQSNNGFTTELVNGTLYSKDLRLYGGGSLGIGKQPDASYPIDIESSGNVNIRMKATGNNAGSRIHMMSGVSDSTYIRFADHNDTTLASIYSYGSSHGAAKELRFHSGGGNRALTCLATGKVQTHNSFEVLGANAYLMIKANQTDPATLQIQAENGLYNRSNWSLVANKDHPYNFRIYNGVSTFMDFRGDDSNIEIYRPTTVSNTLNVENNVAIGYRGSATEMLVVGKDLGNLTSYTGMVFGSNDYAHFFIGESSTSYGAMSYRANLDGFYTWNNSGGTAYYKTWANGNFLKIGSTSTNSTAVTGAQPVDDSDMPGLQLSTSGFSFANGSVDYENASNDFMFLYAKSDKLYLRRGNGTPVVIGST